MRCKGRLLGLSLNWRSHKPEVTLEIEGRAEDLEKLQDMDLSVEIKKYREKRSLNANAYYWTLCTAIAEAIGESTAYVHNHLLRSYGQLAEIDGRLEYVVIPDTDAAAKLADEAQTYHIKPTSEVKPGKDGQMYRTYLMLKGSHDYNSKEMATLIDGAVSEAKSLGIETLPEDELERMMSLYEKHFAS